MNKKNKWVVSFLAAVLAIAMIFGLLAMIAPPAEAAKGSTEIKTELDELEQRKQEAQEKLESLQLEIDAHATEFEKIMAEKALVDQEVALLSQQVDLINQQITVCNALIADRQAELEAAESNLAALQEKNKERLRAMEKNGKLSYWSVIFKASSFTDLLDRLKMIQEIQDEDRRRIEAIGEAIDLVAETKQALEQERAGLLEKEAELDAAMVVLAEKQKEAEAALAKMVAKDEELKALQEQAEQNLGTIKQNILEKQEEYDAAKEKEHQEWLQQQQQNGNGGKPSVDNAGRTWLTPCKYYYVSSPYGMRWHPVHGGYRMHNGVDLAADQGEPIYAVRNGVVNTAAFEYNGAGNYVFIDHQDGFQTAYMHMTHYVVYPGQYVYAGQVIGYVGSTGASSGPHLHFGVYWNWSAVNPADYINF